MTADPRWLIAVAIVILSSFIKGVSGMGGLPIIATPILAVLFDLPTAISLTIPATILADLPILYLFRAQWREARRLVPIVLPAAIGILIGTKILVEVDPGLLRGVLGVLVLMFVAVSYFRFIPRLSDRATRRLGPFVGILGGILQGTAGQSGSIISIFFFQLGLPRAAFLFVINAFFFVTDSTQLVSLASQGLYTQTRAVQAAGIALISMPVLVFAMRYQERISEKLFRAVVLAVLALTGLLLVVRAVLGA